MGNFGFFRKLNEIPNIKVKDILCKEYEDMANEVETYIFLFSDEIEQSDKAEAIAASMNEESVSAIDRDPDITSGGSYSVGTNVVEVNCEVYIINDNGDAIFIVTYLMDESIYRPRIYKNNIYAMTINRGTLKNTTMCISGIALNVLIKKGIRFTKKSTESKSFSGYYLGECLDPIKQDVENRRLKSEKTYKDRLIIGELEDFISRSSTIDSISKKGHRNHFSILNLGDDPGDSLVSLIPTGGNIADSRFFKMSDSDMAYFVEGVRYGALVNDKNGIFISPEKPIPIKKVYKQGNGGYTIKMAHLSNRLFNGKLDELFATIEWFQSTSREVHVSLRKAKL